MDNPSTEYAKFTRYQLLIAVILAMVQFTVALDFRVLAPLGTFVMHDLHLTPRQFADVVAVYAFSAFVSALLTASFADRFDRKRLLLFFFGGFILGTIACSLATSFVGLLLARMITGVFGGVMSSISYAIISDLFEANKRGRVMGILQLGFGVSQIIGIPFGLLLANSFNWHIPFIILVLLSLLCFIVVWIALKPINQHLINNSTQNGLKRVLKTASNKRYITGFLAITLLATGGFMLMPFGSEFAVKNLHIPTNQLHWMYVITGLFTVAAGPAAGYIADRFGKMKLFVFGTFVALAVVLIYTHLGPSTLGLVSALNVVLFIGITSRMVPAQAMLMSVPSANDRGTYMSINAAIQQLSGGISAFIAGLIIYKNQTGTIENYPTLGYVVAVSMLGALFLMWRLHRMLLNDDPAS